MCSPRCPSSRKCPVVRSYSCHCSGLGLKYVGTQPDFTPGEKFKCTRCALHTASALLALGAVNRMGWGELRSARSAAVPQTTLLTLLTHLLGQFSALPQERVRRRPAVGPASPLGEPLPQCGRLVGCWICQTGLRLNLFTLTWEMSLICIF